MDGHHDTFGAVTRLIEPIADVHGMDDAEWREMMPHNCNRATTDAKPQEPVNVWLTDARDGGLQFGEEVNFHIGTGR
jgi:hypothetical protein